MADPADPTPFDLIDADQAVPGPTWRDCLPLLYAAAAWAVIILAALLIAWVRHG